jgi:hypothetical protein
LRLAALATTFLFGLWGAWYLNRDFMSVLFTSPRVLRKAGEAHWYLLGVSDLQTFLSLPEAKKRKAGLDAAFPQAFHPSDLTRWNPKDDWSYNWPYVFELFLSDDY